MLKRKVLGIKECNGEKGKCKVSPQNPTQRRTRLGEIEAKKSRGMGGGSRRDRGIIKKKGLECTGIQKRLDVVISRQMKYRRRNQELENGRKRSRIALWGN